MPKYEVLTLYSGTANFGVGPSKNGVFTSVPSDNRARTQPCVQGIVAYASALPSGEGLETSPPLTVLDVQQGDQHGKEPADGDGHHDAAVTVVRTQRQRALTQVDQALLIDARIFLRRLGKRHFERF